MSRIRFRSIRLFLPGLLAPLHPLVPSRPQPQLGPPVQWLQLDLLVQRIHWLRSARLFLPALPVPLHPLVPSRPQPQLGPPVQWLPLAPSRPYYP
jgi:hypothetical protein